MARKRKTFLVEKQVQGALGWRIAAHWLIFLGLSVSVTCSLQMLGSFEQGTLRSSFEKAMLGQVGSIAVLLALLPWFIHDSLKLSNRFAGPMVRLHKSIIELTHKDEALPVTFRTQDFWQDIATDFNHLQMRVLAERETMAKHGLPRLTSQEALDETLDDESTLPIACMPALPVGANLVAGQTTGLPFA